MPLPLAGDSGEANGFPEVIVACVQMAPRVGQRAENVARSIQLIEQAAAAGAALVVLPELCSSGYVFHSRAEAFALAESVPDGESVRAWAEAARALQRTGSLDTRRLVEAVRSIHFDSPEGVVSVDPDNNHCVLTPRIGVCRADGQFDVVWESSEPVKPDPYLSTCGFSEVWLR